MDMPSSRLRVTVSVYFFSVSLFVSLCLHLYQEPAGLKCVLSSKASVKYVLFKVLSRAFLQTFQYKDISDFAITAGVKCHSHSSIRKTLRQEVRQKTFYVYRRSWSGDCLQSQPQSNCPQSLVSDAFILSMKQKGPFLENLQQQLILTMAEDKKKKSKSSIKNILYDVCIMFQVL